MLNTEKRYAIFIDIDGTLLGKGKEELRKNIDVIQKVRSLGHKVFISTGRATAYLPKEIDFEKQFDGVISGAGARIIVDKEEVFCQLVPFEAVKKIYDFGKTNKASYIFEGVDKTIFFGIKPDGDWIYVDEKNEQDIVNEELRVEKFSIMGSPPKGLGDALGESFAILEHAEYTEIIQKDCTKASAMQFVMKKLGIEKDCSIAMGDSLNDFEMLETAGFGVAMGNAVPEIKNIADMVTTDVNDAGVAKALEKIFNL